MSRYKIATKTDTLRYKIAKEVFGEIEDSDGVRDVPSWEIFEKCLEQHKRISTLEKQLATMEKALELAVETMRYELGIEAIKNLYKDAMSNLKDNLNMKVDKGMCEWYIEQAQKEIKNG